MSYPYNKQPICQYYWLLIIV